MTLQAAGVDCGAAILRYSVVTDLSLGVPG